MSTYSPYKMRLIKHLRDNFKDESNNKMALLDAKHLAEYHIDNNTDYYLNFLKEFKEEFDKEDKKTNLVNAMMNATNLSYFDAHRLCSLLIELHN